MVENAANQSVKTSKQRSNESSSKSDVKLGLVIHGRGIGMSGRAILPESDFEWWARDGRSRHLGGLS